MCTHKIEARERGLAHVRYPALCGLKPDIPKGPKRADVEVVTINGVRFIGATLWTDYRLYGRQNVTMFHGGQFMNDHKRIATQRKPWRRFVPQTAFRMHQESRHRNHA